MIILIIAYSDIKSIMRNLMLLDKSLITIPGSDSDAGTIEAINIESEIKSHNK